MRRLRNAVAVLAVVTAVMPTAVTSQTPVTVSAELAFRSKYLFAGIPFAAEQVQQALVSVGMGSFTVYGFTTWDIDAEDITEADIYADYYRQVTPLLGFFVGGALYNFDFGPDGGGWQATPELYAGAVLGVLLSPTLYVAHDFDLGDGTHVLASVSHSVPLGEGGVSLDLAGNVDYNAEYWTPANGFSYFDVRAGLGVPVGPVTISPIVIVQRRINDAFDGYIVDEEVFGITASVTF
jgi:hypothetical protein